MPTLDRPAQGHKIEIPYAEVIRYLGGYHMEISPEAEALVREGIDKISAAMDPRACYARFPILHLDEEQVTLPCMDIHSRLLARHIAGCSEVILFAATIGAQTDRLIRGAELLSPSRSAVLQAVGAAAIESYCNDLNDRLNREEDALGHLTRRRYSPGYGDFALTHQRDFFRVLECPVRLGISLTEGMLMVPSKSVTALIGIETPQ
ncbi:MAG: vitamin B12 dependent-methionine synthase activation domain-containing protein [Eubacteriales bacterium]|nr:vitamin B12 dependent-methionine synthase activation domain-containing protein [Eubacteriales bacterium]